MQSEKPIVVIPLVQSFLNKINFLILFRKLCVNFQIKKALKALGNTKTYQRNALRELLACVGNILKGSV